LSNQYIFNISFCFCCFLYFSQKILPSQMDQNHFTSTQVCCQHFTEFFDKSTSCFFAADGRLLCVRTGREGMTDAEWRMQNAECQVMNDGLGRGRTGGWPMAIPTGWDHQIGAE
jgi:hypothetical protein